MSDEFPARLHAVFAPENRTAVVFRRGPSKAVCTFLWDRTTDEFSIGQWLKGRIYERRSDLSPDGKYLIYFAMNGKWDSETEGSWTAISRAPYLKAIELYKRGDCWEGGGLFLSNNNFWLNDRYSFHKVLETSEAVERAENYVPEGGYGATINGLRFNAEDTGVYYRRLLRDGWVYKNNPDLKHAYIFEKPLARNWVLVKYAHEGMGSPDGKGSYWDEHILLNTQSKKEILCDDWEWAERDQNDVVWASKGCLYRSKILDDSDIEDPKLLHDFNPYKFEAIKAPYDT